MNDRNKETALNPFRLEDIFKEPQRAFFAYGLKSSAESDVIFVLDTNTLLLPYSVKNNGISQLIDVYRDLARKNRLFLPARAAREFINNRDGKLSEIVKAMQDVKSRVISGENYSSPLFSGLAAQEKIREAHKVLAEAKQKYSKAISDAIEEILAWRGNDTITKLYAEIFGVDSIIECATPKEELLTEWERRSKDKIPPGYKDAAKEDGGIGDFLIWKSILEIGRRYQAPLIFVSGEEKADWVVRANNEPAYPRPELCEEYRVASSGNAFRIASLHQVLAELNAPSSVVEEFEKAEDANAPGKWKERYFITDKNTFPVESTKTLLFAEDGTVVTVGKDEFWVYLKMSLSKDRSKIIIEDVDDSYELRLLSSPSNLKEVMNSVVRSKPRRSVTIKIGQGISIESVEARIMIMSLQDINCVDDVVKATVNLGVTSRKFAENFTHFDVFG